MSVFPDRFFTCTLIDVPKGAFARLEEMAVHLRSAASNLRAKIEPGTGPKAQPVGGAFRQQANRLPCGPALALPRRGVERRAFVRHPVTQRCLCHPVQPRGHALWEARIEDLSTGGLRLTAHHRFQKGEILTIELPNPPAGSRAKFFVRVRHCTYKGAFSVAGCSFIKKLSADELEALLQTLPGWRASQHPR